MGDQIISHLSENINHSPPKEIALEELPHTTGPELCNEGEKTVLTGHCFDDHDIHPVKEPSEPDETKDRASECSDHQSDDDILVSGPRVVVVDYGDTDYTGPHYRDADYEQVTNRNGQSGTSDTGSEFVDKAALRLKCASDESDSKKSLDSASKGDAGHDTHNDDDDETLEIDCYLKKHQPVTVTLTVNMLQTQLPTPVALMHDTGCSDLAFLDSEKYNFELYRLGSFCNFPPDFPCFVSKLSRDGFIFMSEENAIACHFCKTRIRLQELRLVVDVAQLHLSRSPHCPLKLGTSNNRATPIPQESLSPADHAAKESNMAGLAGETSILENNPSVTAPVAATSHSPAISDKAPYHSAPVQNYSTDSGIEVTDSVPSIQQPEHFTVSASSTGSLPSQPARSQPTPKTSAGVRNGSSRSAAPRPAGNGAKKTPASTLQTASVKTESSTEAPKEKKKLTYSDLGIFADKPKRPDMAILSKRLATFVGKWKPSYVQTPQLLAEAGMYYAGYSDCARCFFCGGGLKNWEPPDNPWVEHARWFPKCAYISMAKGPQFVEIIKRKNQNKEDIKLKEVEDEITAMLSKPVNSDGAEANRGRKPADSASGPKGAGQSLNVAANSSHGKDLAELKAENDELRSQTSCKICMDFESTVVFLPCGHLVACANCAIVLKTCPLCRSDIKGSVRAQLS